MANPFDNPSEQRKLIDALDGINRYFQSSSRTASSVASNYTSSASTGNDKSIRDMNDAAEEFGDSLLDGSKSIKNLSDEIDDLQNSLDNLSDQYSAEAEDIKRKIKQNKSLLASTKALKTSLDYTERNTRKNYDAINSVNYNFGKSILSLSSNLEGLTDVWGLENDAADKYFKTMLKTSKSLSILGGSVNGVKQGFDTVAELTQGIGDLAKQTSILEQYMKSGEMPINEFYKSLVDLKNSGVALSSVEQDFMTTVEQAGLATADDTVAFEKHVKMVKRDMMILQQAAEKELALIKIKEAVKEKFGIFGKALSGNASGLVVVTTSLGMLADSAMAMFGQLKAIHHSGFLDSFWRIKQAQFELGVSTEQVTKMMGENTQALFSGGNPEQWGKNMQNFISIINNNQQDLMEFGLSTEESAQALSGFIKNSSQSGIDVKNRKELEKSVKNQGTAFKRMRAMTNISAEEFQNMNAEMINNDSVQSKLNAVDASRREQLINSMMKTRDSFVKMGMSAQEAQKALMSFEDLRKRDIKTRYEQAGKLAAAASMVGINAQRAFQLGSKKNLDEREKQEFVGMMAKLSEERDKLLTAGDERANVLGELIDQNSEAYKAIIDEAQKANIKKQNDAKSEDQVKALMGERFGGAAVSTMAFAEKGFDQIGQVLSDPLIKMIASLAGIGLGISMLIKQSAQLKTIADNTTKMAAGTNYREEALGEGDNLKTDKKSSRKERLKNKIKNSKIGKSRFGTAAGKLGSKIAATPAASVLKGVGVSAIAGLAGDYILGSVKEEAEKEGNTKKAAAADIGQDALTGAGYGATIGSFIPIVGTAVGAALGGLVGGGISAYKNWDTLSEKSPEVAPVITPQNESSPKTVTPAPSVFPGQNISTPTAALTAAGVGLTAASLGQTSQPGQPNVPMVQLTPENIKSIVDNLILLNTTEKDIYDIEVQQLESIKKMTETNSDQKDIFSEIVKKTPSKFDTRTGIKSTFWT